MFKFDVGDRIIYSLTDTEFTVKAKWTTDDGRNKYVVSNEGFDYIRFESGLDDYSVKGKYEVGDILYSKSAGVYFISDGSDQLARIGYGNAGRLVGYSNTSYYAEVYPDIEKVGNLSSNSTFSEIIRNAVKES